MTSSVNETAPGALRWLLGSIAVFLISLTFGAVLPDGLNWFLVEIGKPKFEITPLTRFFSVVIVFLSASVAELALWMRSSMSGVSSMVRQALAQEMTPALESALVGALLPQLRTHDDAARKAGELIQTFSSALSTVPPSLMRAHSVLFERGLADLTSMIAQVHHDGLDVDINEHIEISRRCAERASSFVTINRSAFKVPTEWTKDWCQFVEELGQRRIAKEYIVLMTKRDLTASVSKINGMRTYLEERGWTLRTCDSHDVQESLGGVLPTEANVDVFDRRVAKLQQPPHGGYRGGIKLRLTIVDLDSSQELRRFVDRVLSIAV